MCYAYDTDMLPFLHLPCSTIRRLRVHVQRFFYFFAILGTEGRFDGQWKSEQNLGHSRKIWGVGSPSALRIREEGLNPCKGVSTPKRDRAGFFFNDCFFSLTESHQNPMIVEASNRREKKVLSQRRKKSLQNGPRKFHVSFILRARLRLRPKISWTSSKKEIK